MKTLLLATSLLANYGPSVAWTNTEPKTIKIPYSVYTNLTSKVDTLWTIHTNKVETARLIQERRKALKARTLKVVPLKVQPSKGGK